MPRPLSSPARLELPKRPVPQPERYQPLVRGRLRDPDSSRQPYQRRHPRIRDSKYDLRVHLLREPGSVPDADRGCADLADALAAQVKRLAYGGKRAERLVGCENRLVASFHRRISLETARSHAATRAVGSWQDSTWAPNVRVRTGSWRAVAAIRSHVARALAYAVSSSGESEGVFMCG